jgi:peptide deformylase
MALLPVLTIPDPRLKLVAQPVESVNADVRQLMEDLLETMYHEKGAGLAATQVGIQKRVLVIDFGDDNTPHIYRMANPEIFWRSETFGKFTEGCLSVPDQWAEVKRPNEVKVRYLDEDNTLKELHAVGDLADCIQHEVDHLDGILYIDHLSTLKRHMLFNKALKAKKVKRL